MKNVLQKPSITIQYLQTKEKPISVLNVLKTQSDEETEFTNFQIQRIIMKKDDEDYKELMEASFSVLQLVINMPDNEGRIKRLRNILSKIKEDE